MIWGVQNPIFGSTPIWINSLPPRDEPKFQGALTTEEDEYPAWNDNIHRALSCTWHSGGFFAEKTYDVGTRHGLQGAWGKNWKGEDRRISGKFPKKEFVDCQCGPP